MLADIYLYKRNQNFQWRGHHISFSSLSVSLLEFGDVGFCGGIKPENATLPYWKRVRAALVEGERFHHCIIPAPKEHINLQCETSLAFQNGSVILISPYLISWFFFMITQTRQFPTISMTTSMECTVAMAMPDDWSMTVDRCCWYDTVVRPRQNEISTSEFLITELVIWGYL